MRIFCVVLLIVDMLLLSACSRVERSVVSLSWQAPKTIAVGNGLRGPWHQNRSEFDYVDDPTVALDDRGNALVAWVDQARKDVFFQRFDAAEDMPAAQAINVSVSPATFSWLPRLALDRASPASVYLIWQEIIFSGASHGGEIYFSRSENGGASFQRPLNLSNSAGGDGKGRIHRKTWHNGSFDLIADGGRLYAAWTEYDGALWFSRSLDGGRTFSSPQRLAGNSSSRPARAPSLALGGKGKVYLAWTVGEDLSADIHLLRSDDGGERFGPARIVTNSTCYSDAPKLAVDSRDVVHLVYAERCPIWRGRDHVRYTRSDNEGRDFELARDISKSNPTLGVEAGFPAVALDARDLLYVLWERFPRRGARPRGLEWVVSADGGRRFTRPELIPDSVEHSGAENGGLQGLLMKKLSLNSAGDVAVVNSSFRPGHSSRVWLMRGISPEAASSGR